MNAPDRSPTTTAIPARVRLFQPSIRPKEQLRNLVETSYGKVTITGRLGQRHADLLEAILFHAFEFEIVEAGDCDLLDCWVKPHEVRKSLGEKQYSYSQTWKLFKELKSATVELETTAVTVVGSIIDLVSNHHDPGACLYGALEDLGGKTIWRVRLGAVMVKLLKYDIRRYYDPGHIAGLRTGAAKAVARWLLTHDKTKQPAGGWKLDTVLHAVLGPMSDSALRDKRRDVRSESQRLALAGISLKDDRLSMIFPKPHDFSDAVGHPPAHVG